MANNRANFAETTLGAAIADADDTAITVTSGTSFPAAPFLVTIGTEILKCTSKGTGEDWTVTRGEQGSTAAAHDNGTKVENNITAGDFEVVPNRAVYGSGISADTMANTIIGGELYNATAGTQAGYKFTAEQSSALVSVLLNWKDETHEGYGDGDGGTITITLQSDNGSGLPSGTVLATIVVANPADGYQTYTFTTPYTLVKGQVYHLVFTNTAADPVNNYVSVNNIVALGDVVVPRNPRFLDAECGMTRQQGTGAWGVMDNYTPLFQVTYGNGKIQGVGYRELEYSDYATISGTTGMARESFTVSGGDKIVSSVAVRVRRTEGTGDLVLRLETAAGTLIEAVNIPAASVPASAPGSDNAGAVWVKSSFLSLHRLVDGVSYNLRLSTDGSTTYTVIALRKADTNGFAANTYFADGGSWETTDGSTWTIWPSYATPDNDLRFYFDLVVDTDNLLQKTGGTMVGNLVMDNTDITLVKLLTLHGEIDDGNSSVSKLIDWNLGAAHKVTLTANAQLAFLWTTDICVGGTVTASSESGTRYAVNAFDGDLETTWNPNDTVGCWLKYQLATAKIVTGYRICDFGTHGYGPAPYTLEGSNNDSDWDVLDTQASLAWGAWVSHTITSPASYLYYRINMPTLADVEITELELFEGSAVNPVAPCFLTLKLVQDATGGRVVTWPATVKGTPAINLAINATSNVLFYWDGTNYWTLNGKQFVSATDKVLGRSTAGAGEIEEIACTAAGRALLDDATAAAQLATLGAAAAADVSAKLAKAGDTMTGNLIMDNMDVTLVKLLTLHGEIDDGNSSTADTIDWNLGTAHKSTLTGNVTFAFTGYGTDICTGGTATDSHHWTTHTATQVFDDNDTTYWVSGDNVATWIKYQLSSAQTALAYGLKRGTVTGEPPTSWTLYGSNNDTDWVELDVRTSQPSNVDWGYYEIAIPASYLYYRLSIPLMNDAEISEMTMYAVATVNPPAPCFLTLKLVQDGTGGRTVTWPATVKGSPIINQAPSTTSNILFYWDGTNYYTLNGLPWVTAPASSGAAGFVGQMAYDASYLYVCTAANTWERVAVATW